MRDIKGNKVETFLTEKEKHLKLVINNEKLDETGFLTEQELETEKTYYATFTQEELQKYVFNNTYNYRKKIKKLEALIDKLSQKRYTINKTKGV